MRLNGGNPENVTSFSSMETSGRLKEGNKDYQGAINHGEADTQENGPSESFESSDSSSSSEDEVVVQFQKPLFLRSGKRKHSDDRESQERQIKKQEAVAQKIQLENQAIQAREELQLQTKNNYTTNNDIVQQAIMLDDNDSIDPEHEKEQWLKRQELRQQRRRDAMIAKQMEIEEYEANKLKSLLAEDLGKNEIPTHQTKFEKLGPKPSSARKWKPSRAQDTHLADSSATATNSKEETEYSWI